MSKSSSRGLFGRRTTGTVTVLETRVHRATARKAKIAFVVTAVVVGLLAAIVLTDHTHPVLALFGGAVIGAAFGSLVWAAVTVWPAIRVVWWWLPEILCGLGAVYGFTGLAHVGNLAARIAVIAVVVGVPAAVPVIRRQVVAWVWCLVVRHRLRTSFAQFIITNSAGTLPLICWAHPTPVGERVWIWLRPGLSRAEIDGRADKLAAACWAAQVKVTSASSGNSAFLRLDIKRREFLDQTFTSPLVAGVGTDAPAVSRPVQVAPSALDLPDIADISDGLRKPSTKQATTSANGTTPGGDDVNDWI